ncbi:MULTISPECIES: maltose/maltodextrin ABC transporter substrate-binding protein MalE [Endozoicomonas]|uniref:maltose/maltodextrin ABC transporter substrate-binding protein MalE n=1 Tax=Endozoicomonas TaxID=305899 RepID=UPI00036DBFD3|nr:MULTISPECIES: maltose/maltodextrin ABC transporter substrate-binding protein MalE [Endozoicomonas]
MSKTNNIFVKTLAAAVAASTLFAGSVQAFSEDELVIWVGGDKAYNGIREVGKRFEEETGIKVKVEIPQNITDRFQQAASTGAGPDIMLWAHDRYGEWAASGLLAPVSPSAEFKADVVEKGWEAMSFKGKTYGYPISMESISLIYNKDIIPEAPASFEAMFELNNKLAKKDIKTIMWDQVQPYFTMPMLAANGGYPFAYENGSYNIKKTGVNNDGAMKGAQMITKMIDADVLPRGVDYGVMESTFNNGKVAMMITGPWAWSNLDKSGINYGVAPLPSIDGSPSRAFVGVWGAALNNASPNQALSAEFLENYLLSIDGLKTMNADVPLGAVANRELMAELQKDPRIAATWANVEAGLLMPNIPEMGKFWSAMESALRNITSGRQVADAALNDAASRIVN